MKNRLIPLLALVLCVGTLHGPKAAIAQGDASERTRDNVRKELVAACADDPALHGAWILDWTPGAGEQGDELTIIVDTDKAKEQVDTISRRLDVLTPKPRISKVHELPLSKLVRDLRPAIEGRTEMKGCFVSGAHYLSHPARPDSRGLELVLYGRVFRKEQLTQITDECGRLMRSEPAWKRFEETTPKILMVVDRQLPAIPFDDREEKSLQATLAKIRGELRDDKTLHGSWIDMARCFDHKGEFSRYHVDLLLEESSAEAQESRIKTLLDDYVDLPFEIVRRERFPLEQLVAELQDELRKAFGRGGCWIKGAYYDDASGEDNKTEIMLYGRYYEKREEQIALEACRKLMERNPVWRHSVWTVFEPSSAKLVSDAALATSEEAFKKRRKLCDKIGATVDLHGAWVSEMTACLNHRDAVDHYDLYVWYDAGRADVQRIALEKLVQARVGGKYEIVAETELPLSKLVANLRTTLEEEFRKKGCWVSGGYYEDSSTGDGETDIVLYGRLYREPNALRVVDACAKLLRADLAWSRVEPMQFKPVASKLTVPREAPPHLHEARERFVEARDNFRGAVHRDPKLHGAWIDLVPCFDHNQRLHHYDLYIVVDTAKATEQLARVDGLLPQLDAPYEKITTVNVPLSKLVGDLRTELESKFGRKGCWVGGSYYEAGSQSDELDIVLFGKFYDDRRAALVLESCRRLLAAEPAWHQVPPMTFTPTDRKLKNPPPSVAQVKAELKTSLESVQEQLRDDSRLHGIWVEADPCFDELARLDHHDVTLWVDDAKAATQRRLGEELLSRHLGVPGKIVDQINLPLSSLVSELQAAAQNDFGKLGCWVRGAYYSPGDRSEDVKLQLFGRVFESTVVAGRLMNDESQRQLILQRCEELVRSKTAWQLARPANVVPVGDGLRLDKPSPEMFAIRSNLRQALFDDPRLHGVWVDLAECLDHRGQRDHYEVYLWLDRPVTTSDEAPATAQAAATSAETERPSADSPSPSLSTIYRRVWSRRCWSIVSSGTSAQTSSPQGGSESEGELGNRETDNRDNTWNWQQQREEVSQLLDQWLGVNRYSVLYQAELPFSQLLADLRKDVESRFGRGCFVTGAYYTQHPDESSSKDVEISLYGDAFNETQKSWIMERADQLLRIEPSWLSVPSPRGAVVRLTDRKLRAGSSSPELAAATKSIQAAIRANLQLHGTWAELAECLDHRDQLDHYEVYLWLDQGPDSQLPARSGTHAPTLSDTAPARAPDSCCQPSSHAGGRQEVTGTSILRTSTAMPVGQSHALSAKEQREQLQKLLDEALGGKPYGVVSAIELPYSQWLCDLRRRAEAEFGKGCFVVGAYYNRTADSKSDIVELVVRGLVLREEQRNWILDEARTLLASDPRWPPTLKPGDLHISLVERLSDGALSADARDAREAIRMEIFNRAELHGAWVDLVECKDSLGRAAKHDVYLWLDRTRAAKQRPAALALLDQWLGADNYRILYESHLPLSQTVAQTIRSLKTDSPNACYSAGAYYHRAADAPEDNVEIVLYGQTIDEQQKLQVKDAFSRLMEDDPVWSRAPSPWGVRLTVSDRGLTPYKASPRIQDRLRRIHEAIAAHPQLHGVWLELRECVDHHGNPAYDAVSVRRDETWSTEQEHKLRKLLDEFLENGYAIEEEIKLPILRLVDRINLMVEGRVSLSGCLVDGIYFTVDSTEAFRPKLQPYGRIAEDTDREELRELVAQELARDLDWKPLIGQFDVRADKISVVEPSLTLGAQLFSRGIQHYWAGRFEDADWAFKHAIVESPSALGYRYWRVLAEIESGRLQDAYDHLAATAARRPTDLQYRRLSSVLQRVQGPTRTELIRLDYKARAAFYRLQDDG